MYKLISEKVLALMTDLKKPSANGSTGFGALSEKELSILQNAATALKRDLNPEDALRYLNDIEQIHNKVLNGGQGTEDGGSDAPSEEDILFTMQQNNMTREQVLEALKG
jgi:NACalpha-BTF3-like transcription factor